MMDFWWMAPLGHGVRKADDYGNGTYGASRDGGARQHLGIDFSGVELDEWVCCPIDGELSRVGFAYPGDVQYRSMVIVSSIDPRYSMKMLYVLPKDSNPGESYLAGDHIGRLQDLTLRYGIDAEHANPITPHVHTELWIQDSAGLRRIDPRPFLVESRP